MQYLINQPQNGGPFNGYSNLGQDMSATGQGVIPLYDARNEKVSGYLGPDGTRSQVDPFADPVAQV